MCVRFCARTPGIMHATADAMPIQDSVMGKSPSKPRYWSPLADTCVLNPHTAYRGKSDSLKPLKSLAIKCVYWGAGLSTN